MKKLLIAALISASALSAQGQTIDTKVSVPICDSIIRVTVEVLNNKLAADEQLQTLNLYITETTKTGYVRSYNKTVPNTDTALTRQLRDNIAKEALKP